MAGTYSFFTDVIEADLLEGINMNSRKLVAIFNI